MKRILVVAAHADDEVLGCGGSLAHHANRGHDVAALFMTNGVGSRDSANANDCDIRQRAMKTALDILGVAHHKQMDFPDNAMDSMSLLDVAKAIEAFCRDWGMPDRVYTHHPGDLNIDHQITHHAVMTCFRPQPNSQGLPSSILAFEVLSSTGWLGSSMANAFVPNYFVDVSFQLKRKMKAIKAYSAEMREWPHARSVEATEYLAKFRGASIGVSAAEAFVVERIIE